MVMAMEYGSSPVEQPALQTRSVRGFFQNLRDVEFRQDALFKRLEDGRVTKERSLLSQQAARAGDSYSTLDLRMARSRSLPRA